MKMKRGGAVFLLKAAVFFFLCLLARDHIPWERWTKPILTPATISVLILLGLLFLLHLSALAAAWRWILSFFDERIGLLQAWRIHAISALGKYIPGSIWPLVGKVRLAQSAGIAIGTCSSSMLPEIICNFCGAFLAFCLLDAAGGSVLIAYPGCVLPVVLVALFTLMHPRFFGPLVVSGHRLLGKSPPTVTLSFSRLLLLLLFFTVDWCLLGLGFSVIVLGQTAQASSSALTLAAVLPLAWLVGVLGFVMPGGIGIREGAVIVMLGLLGVDLVHAFNISILCRLWMTLPELLAAAFFLFVFTGKGQGPAGKDRRA